MRVQFPKSLFQSEANWEAIDMKMCFYSNANKTLFHKKGFALSLVVKVRAFGTRKWLIHSVVTVIWASPFPKP